MPAGCLARADATSRSPRIASTTISPRSRVEARAGAHALRPARDSRRRDHAESLPQQQELPHRRAEHHRVHQRRSAGGRHPPGDPAAGRASASPAIRITGRPDASRSAPATCGTTGRRLAELVDVWEAANRDDLFSVTSLKHYPYVANSDFHKPKHLYSWKTLLRCEKNWDAIARSAPRERRRRADAVPQRLLGGVTYVVSGFSRTRVVRERPVTGEG